MVPKFHLNQISDILTEPLMVVDPIPNVHCTKSRIIKIELQCSVKYLDIDSKVADGCLR